MGLLMGVRPSAAPILLRDPLLGLEIPGGTAVLVAGPPGVGKTSLGLRWCRLALEALRPALYGTWEHRPEQVLAWTADWPDPLRAELLILAAGRSTALGDVAEALRAARMDRHRPGLLVLDYLQLIPVPPPPGRLWRPGDGAVEAFRWALDWAQASRGVAIGISAVAPEGWSPGRSIMGSLAGEAVEMAYDADVVIGLYPEGPGRVRFRIEKNRLGPAGEGVIGFDGARRAYFPDSAGGRAGVGPPPPAGRGRRAADPPG